MSTLPATGKAGLRLWAERVGDIEDGGVSRVPAEAAWTPSCGMGMLQEACRAAKAAAMLDTGFWTIVAMIADAELVVVGKELRCQVLTQ